MIVCYYYSRCGCDYRTAEYLTRVRQAAIQYALSYDLESYYSVCGVQPENDETFSDLLSKEGLLGGYKIGSRADSDAGFVFQFGGVFESPSDGACGVVHDGSEL